MNIFFFIAAIKQRRSRWPGSMDVAGNSIWRPAGGRDCRASQPEGHQRQRSTIPNTRGQSCCAGKRPRRWAFTFVSYKSAQMAVFDFPYISYIFWNQRNCSNISNSLTNDVSAYQISFI